MYQNFNIIVLIITIIVYIILRYNKDPENKSSNFYYLLFVPITLYFIKYVYDISNASNIINVNNPSNISSVVEDNNVIEDLLTAPYPVTTSD